MPINRRRFLYSMGATALAAAPSRGAQAETSIIHPNAAYYRGWPTLARTRKGRLLLVCSGGRESHVCPFGRVELVVSSDGGESWSEPQILMDSPIDDRDAGVVEAADGSLLVTTFTSLAYEDRWNKELRHADTEQAKRWRSVQMRTTPAERRRLLGTWMLRSPDGGLTWSAPYRVPVNSPHGPVLLSDGRLLYAGKSLWGPEDWVGVAESTDHGVTWRRLAAIPTRPGDDRANYHELHAVAAADGRLIAHIRNHNERNYRETLQSESTDGGRTWSVPRPIGVWGLPSHLLRLRDDRLLMSYGYRREPFGIQARVSEDHGRSWSPPITVTDDGFDHDLGYPSTVERNDGRLVTVWYERIEETRLAVLRQVVWGLDA